MSLAICSIQEIYVATEALSSVSETVDPPAFSSDGDPTTSEGRSKRQTILPGTLLESFFGVRRNPTLNRIPNRNPSTVDRLRQVPRRIRRILRVILI